MTVALSVYSLLGVGAAGISALIARQAWRNRNQRGARPFIWLMLALGGWSLFYGLQLSVTTSTGQLLWQRVGLAVGGTVPTVWLVFTLHYLGREAWLTRRRVALLVVDPLLFGALVLTNPAHGLIWNSATLVSTSGGPVLSLSIAWGYYVHIGYAYLLISVGLGFFFSVFERTSTIYRRQAAFLILGVLPPFFGNIAYTARLSWGPLPALDPTPFLFVLTGGLWALALYQFDLLNRTPLARRRIVDEMGDGLVVLDADQNVVNANTIATRVFDPPPETGRPIAACLPDGTETGRSPRKALAGRTLTARVDGKQRAYDVEWSALTDEQETTVGHMIALRDVTDRNEYEQRLEVAQRVLRHNLRNEMTVIKAWADELSHGQTDGESDAAQYITETAEELIELSDKTHTMVQMDPSTSGERVRINVNEQLSSVVDSFATAHPEATIEFDVPHSLDVSLPDKRHLLTPVENLVENALEHNDADEPWVRVRGELAGDHVEIRVEDNGPPIPDMERTVLETGTEDALNHGSGLGLWLTYWSVKTAGGRVEFEQREPRGNVVTLELTD